MNPAPSDAAYPSAFSPRPLICECGAIREERVADAVGGGGTALCATGAEDEAPAVDAFITVDMVEDMGEEVEDAFVFALNVLRDARRSNQPRLHSDHVVRLDWTPERAPLI